MRRSTRFACPAYAGVFSLGDAIRWEEALRLVCPGSHGVASTIDLITQPQGRVAFLPYSLLTQKPQKTHFLAPPKTMGDHIRKRRIQLGWGATQLAAWLKVSKDTVYNWEHNRSKPSIRFMPRVAEFLGHDPTDSAAISLGERIRKHRIQHGLSQEKLAIQLEIDPLTIRRSESNIGTDKKSLENNPSNFDVLTTRKTYKVLHVHK